MAIKSMRVHNCPSCHGTIEEFSRFCKHCGANVDTFTHGRFVKVLLYFIVFLVFALALIIFFSPTLVNLDSRYSDDYTTINVGEGTKENFLKVNNAICNWEDNEFNLCATVNWKGNTGDYMQCSFAGNLDDKKLYSSPVTCCSRVGTEEGVKLARAFLFDENGNNYKEDTLSVTCLGKPNKQTTVKSEVEEPKKYQTNLWFTAKPKNTPAKGNGVIYVDMPGKVKNCDITGKWIMKEPTQSSDAQYCVGGEGVFYGSADLFGQSVFSDPSAFIWAGPEKHYIDPEGMLHQGYSAYLYLCDNQYAVKPRYFVNAKLEGFETNKLTLEWEYFSNYPRPNAEVFVNLNCEMM